MNAPGTITVKLNIDTTEAKAQLAALRTEAQTVHADQIARVCHEANRALQIAHNDPAPSPQWEDAPAWQKRSAVEGVLKALSGATPEQLHQSWCEFKEQDGWAYGPVKDADAKTHPCLVPYDELPEEQKVKDLVFSAIVASLA